MVVVNKGVGGIDAWIEDEEFAQLFIVHSCFLSELVELDTKANFRGEPGVLHVFDEFGGAAIDNTECMTRIVDVLE